MNKKIIFRILKFLMTAAALVFLVFAIWVSWQQIAGENFNIRPLYLAASVFFCLLFFFVQAIGWKWCVQRLSKDVGIGPATSSWFISQVVKYVPGKVMLPIYRVIYGGRMGVEKSKVLLSLMVELVLMTVSSTIVFLLMVPFLSEKVHGFISWPLLGATCIGGLVVIHPKVMNFGVNVALKLAKREPVSIDFPYKSLLGLLAFFIIGWVFYGTSAVFTILAVANPWGTNIDFFVITTAIFTISWTVGFLTFLTPGGAGVREFFLAIVLMPYMYPALNITIEGVGDISQNAPLVLIVAVFSRLVWMFAEVLGAGITLPWRPKEIDTKAAKGTAQ